MAPSNSFGPLVSAGWLADHLDEVRVIDFRWYLDDASKGRKVYEAGHIPGAVFVDLEDVTGHEGAGRHPLPTVAQLQDAMRRAGVNRADRVVIYDDNGGGSAARLWWLLLRHGHPFAAILDGGIGAWTGPQPTEAANPPLGDIELTDADPLDVLSADEVAQLPDGITLIDVRAPERYTGENEPIDPVAGHIPGAVNAFWQDNLAPDGRYLPADELRAKYEALGVRGGNAVVYCGSGVTSCQTLVALELAGLAPARMYAGSWSDWSSRGDVPVATGAD